MATQWHPLFGHLLGLSLGEHYLIEPEKPVSDLPRAGDFFVVRRTGESPPFTGLWSNLTEYNVLEFKGPGESPEDMHLLKLLAVGFGLAYRVNEQRAAMKPEERLPPVRPSRFSFWYLAPYISLDFYRTALSRLPFVHDGAGLYKANVAGHPFFLVSTRDLPVEEDSIPLRLVDRSDQPKALGELIVGQQGLKSRFGKFLSLLHRGLFEEVRGMAGRTGIIDWDVMAKYDDLSEVIDILPPKVVIERLGEKKAIEVMGVKKAVEVMGLDRVIAEVGPDQMLAALEASMPPEQFQALLATRAKKEGGA